MALETKVILKLLANTVAKSKTVEEAYIAIAEAAAVTGMVLPNYKDAVKALEEIRNQEA